MFSNDKNDKVFTATGINEFFSANYFHGHLTQRVVSGIIDTAGRYRLAASGTYSLR
jgi:hypothetical protein